MHRFLIIMFLVALAGLLVGWSATAQEKVPPAPPQDPPAIDKPKDPTPKEKEKPGKDEKPAKFEDTKERVRDCCIFEFWEAILVQQRKAAKIEINLP